MELLENDLLCKFEIEFNGLVANLNFSLKSTGLKELWTKVKETELSNSSIMSFEGLHSFFGIQKQ